MSPSRDDDTVHEALCARARRLSAQWGEQAAGVEAARGLPPQAVDALHDAQLLQIVMPVRYGGLGLEWRSLLEVSRIAARSCASTAWTIGLIGAHVGIAARLPRACQRELFAEGPRQFFSTASARTSGSILRDGDGYRIQGTWRFSSGVDHATWIIVNGRVDNDKPTGPGELMFFAVRPEQLRIDDQWHVAGMRGTGSRDLHFDDVWVPSARTGPLAECFGAEPPGGLAGEGGYVFRVPFLPYIGSAVVGPLLGCAEGALAAYLRMLDAKKNMAPGSAGAPAALLERLAESAAELACAEHLYDATVSTLTAAGRAHRALTPIEHATLRRDRAYLAKLCVNAVQRLVRQLGATGMFESNPMHRHWRDLQVMASHMDVNWDAAMASYANELVASPSVR
jgi:3-hydroxy-9,10-secoandrosta-1,3,5(10)-triene-9,17-dione monooxygenase